MHERLERLEDELFHLDEAIEALTQVPDCEDIIEILKGMRRTTELERNIEHSRVEIQDIRDDAELSREYEKSTI